MLKAVDLAAQEARAARRAGRSLSSAAGPMLCVITPSMSRGFAVEAGAQPVAGGARGLRALAPMWRAVIVIVNELPEESATLWLRLLGRGAVQARAARQLLEMSEREPLRDATLKLLVAWQESLPLPEQQTEEERELRMNWEQAYERWERKVEAKGRREGKMEGKAEAVIAVLEGRGLAITAAQRKQVLACDDAAQIDAWLRAAGTAPSVAALLGSGGRTRRPPVKRRRAATPTR